MQVEAAKLPSARRNIQQGKRSGPLEQRRPRQAALWAAHESVEAQKQQA
jgi:hypothetical protein